jgi:hypothetical protein
MGVGGEHKLLFVAKIKLLVVKKDCILFKLHTDVIKKTDS